MRPETPVRGRGSSTRSEAGGESGTSGEGRRDDDEYSQRRPGGRPTTTPIPREPSENHPKTLLSPTTHPKPDKKLYDAPHTLVYTCSFGRLSAFPASLSVLVDYQLPPPLSTKSVHNIRSHTHTTVSIVAAPSPKHTPRLRLPFFHSCRSTLAFDSFASPRFSTIRPHSSSSSSRQPG